LLWTAALVVVAVAATAIAGFLRKPSSERPVVRFLVPAAEGITEMRWPRISPDGTMIAFQARSVNARPSIWVRPIDSFEARELQGTEGAGRHWWSPDSRYIAFFMGSQLKKIPAGGGPLQLIAEGESGADGDW